MTFSLSQLVHHSDEKFKANLWRIERWDL
jgi:hypothetical protein